MNPSFCEIDPHNHHSNRPPDDPDFPPLPCSLKPCPKNPSSTKSQGAYEKGAFSTAPSDPILVVDLSSYEKGASGTAPSAPNLVVNLDLQDFVDASPLSEVSQDGILPSESLNEVRTSFVSSLGSWVQRMTDSNHSAEGLCVASEGNGVSMATKSGLGRDNSKSPVADPPIRNTSISNSMEAGDGGENPSQLGNKNLAPDIDMYMEEGRVAISSPIHVPA
ncbi:hypothetical protein Hanom_Chr12g01112601 [Helianthus anomalus]